MKKRFLIVLLFLLVFSIAGFADRIGIDGPNPSMNLVLRPGPFDIRLGWNLQENGGLFLSGDYRIVSGLPLITPLHFFMSAGLFTEIPFSEGQDIGFGAHIPVGIQLFLAGDAVEIYAYLAPVIAFLPSISMAPFEGWHGYLGFTVKMPKF